MFDAVATKMYHIRRMGYILNGDWVLVEVGN
jgi:hypothetical protein